MKYLVTGSTGLLGNNVVRQLVSAGHSVRVLTRGSSDPRPLEGLHVEAARGDVREASAVTAACAGMDVVIHSAGHVHLGWTQLDQHQQINVEGTRHVAAAARAAGARLVHVSTVNALGLGLRTEPADEETALPGIVECPYVLTKRAAEQAVLDEVGRGLWAAIVNPGLLMGPWDWKPSSGKMFLAVAKFAPWAPLGAASFCDARDVAAGTIAASTRAASGRRYILAGHNLTYREGWQVMARIAGQRGPLLPMGPIFRAIVLPIINTWNALAREESSANSAALAMGRQQHCFSSRRAERELGYRIRPLEETLRDMHHWFVEHGYLKSRRQTTTQK
jgi:dihydroflavonol-4-reductase